MESIIQQALVDEAAMSQLLDELEPMVFRIAFHLIRHQQDAEDVAQEVLYKICTRLSTYRGDSSLHTWVYAMVMNAYRDFLRKKKIRQAEELPDTLRTQSFEEATNDRLFWQKVLQELPEVDRNILVLRFQNDLSVREVASIMNLSEANVKTRVFRIKDRLRSLFFKGGEVL